MKLVKIEHERCGETDWDATSYVMAPDDMTKEQFLAAVRRAQDAYLAYVEEWNNTAKVPDPGYHPQYDKHPDKTVAEVQAIHEANKAAYKEWSAKESKAKRTFADYLITEGFKYLWDEAAPDFETEIWWGHRHGSGIEYKIPVPDDRETAIIKSDRDDWT